MSAVSDGATPEKTATQRQPRRAFRQWMAKNDQSLLWGAGLTTGAAFIVFCWLYLLGLDYGFAGGAVRVVFAISLPIWCFLLRFSRPRNRAIWKRYRSAGVERVEMVVAAVLWLLIYLSILCIILWRWHSAH